MGRQINYKMVPSAHHNTYLEPVDNPRSHRHALLAQREAVDIIQRTCAYGRRQRSTAAAEDAQHAGVPCWAKVVPAHNSVALDDAEGKGAAAEASGEDDLQNNEGAAAEACGRVLQGGGVRVALVPHLYWWT